MSNAIKTDISVNCQYCKEPAILVDSAEVYNGRSYGPIWICRPCGAYVGVHRKTNHPKGSLAKAPLRAARKRAHAAFDPLWRSKEMTRSAAYKWLASQLGIRKERCHIAYFDEVECDQVVEIMRLRRKPE